MDVQTSIIASRLARISGLKAEVARLRAENLHLRGEIETVQAHFSLALMAALDCALLAPRGRFFIVDGWNVVLGEGRRPRRTPRSPQRILALARRYLAIHKQDFIWIVWDGRDEGGWQKGRLRVSWTGGTGKQRADRMICDFVRMARWRGLALNIRVISADKALAASVRRISSK